MIRTLFESRPGDFRPKLRKRESIFLFHSVEIKKCGGRYVISLLGIKNTCNLEGATRFIFDSLMRVSPKNMLKLVVKMRPGLDKLEASFV